MSLRCGCPDQGDETVFGECRTCKPIHQADGVDLAGALVGALRRARELRKADFTLSPQEPRDRPYEITLSDGDGDLG